MFKVADLEVPLGTAIGEAQALVPDIGEQNYLGVRLFQDGFWKTNVLCLKRLYESLGWKCEVRKASLLCQAANAGSFASHTDSGFGLHEGQTARVHIPLVTAKKATLNFGASEIEIHLPVGGVYFFDPTKPHSISNKSDVHRIHFVVDVEVDAEVRHAIMSAPAFGVP